MKAGEALSSFLIVILLAWFAGCLAGCGDCSPEEKQTSAQGSLDLRGTGTPGSESDYVVPPANLSPPPFPEWCLRHWVWEDESTQESAMALVEGYLDRGIPVGAVIIDSPWETGYNTFEFDPVRYPRPREMIDRFHQLGVRVVLWITPNVNVDSPNYQEGASRRFFLGGNLTKKWWKGTGAFIDYTNPQALNWWRRLMDKALELGIDGWKCDETAAYFEPWEELQAYSGTITARRYQEMYYRDFFQYTRQRLGRDRIIMARAVDTMPFPLGSQVYAPPEINFAGWAGDQQPTFTGLRLALHNVFLSAEAGYGIIGSDIGGYFGTGKREKKLFVRWAQFGALCPLMENGGQGEHRPWKYDEEVLRIYRRFVLLHQELSPYLYSIGAKALASGHSVMKWIDEKAGLYLLGEDLLVMAVYDPSSEIQAVFPQGTWIHYWSGKEYKGGEAFEAKIPLAEYPVFLRKGAVLPLNYGECGTALSQDETGYPVTYFIAPDFAGAFDLYEQDGPGVRVSYEAGETMRLQASASSRLLLFRIRGIPAPREVWSEPHGIIEELADPSSLCNTASGWISDASGDLWIKPGSADKGIRLIIH